MYPMIAAPANRTVDRAMLTKNINQTMRSCITKTTYSLYMIILPSEQNSRVLVAFLQRRVYVREHSMARVAVPVQSNGNGDSRKVQCRSFTLDWTNVINKSNPEEAGDNNDRCDDSTS